MNETSACRSSMIGHTTHFAVSSKVRLLSLSIAQVSSFSQYFAGVGCISVLSPLQCCAVNRSQLIRVAWPSCTALPCVSNIRANAKRNRMR